MFLRRISKGKDKGNIVKNRRVHLANERTFLAWIRTSIGIMAFVFFMGRFGVQPVSKASSTWSCNCVVYAGLFLVLLGAIVALMAIYLVTVG